MAFLLGFELWQTPGDDSFSTGSGQAQNNVFFFSFSLLPKREELSQGGSEGAVPSS